MKPVAFQFYLITLCGSLLLTGCKEDKKAIVESMVKYGAYEGKYLGPTSEISPQWKNYQAIKTRFSENELAELCEHKNPVVRCYAFKALTENRSEKVYAILLKHLTDTARFERFYGCLGSDDIVTDNYLEQVGYDGSGEINYTLTDDQYGHIDSLLLFGDEIKEKSKSGGIKYISRRFMLERITPQPQLYTRIKEIVEAGVIEALPLLARYQNANDTNLFKKLLLEDEFSNEGRKLKHQVRVSIKYFPHPAFYPLLKQLLIAEIGTNGISDDYESFPLYKALAQYPSRETRELFEYALGASGKEYEMRSAYIYFAVKKYPARAFDGLLSDFSYVDKYDWLE